MQVTLVELVRIAYESRLADATERSADAIRKAIAIGDEETARALTAIVLAYAGRHLQRTEGPTPETIRQSRRPGRGSAIKALLSRGTITSDEAIAAGRIAAIVEAITRCVSIRPRSYDGGGGGIVSATGHYLWLPDRLEEEYRLRYLPWAAWMQAPESRMIDGGRPSLPVVLDVCAYGESINTVSARLRIRKGTVTALLVGGLERYARMM